MGILMWRNNPEAVAISGFQNEGRRPLSFAIFEYLNCFPALSSRLIVKSKNR